MSNSDTSTEIGYWLNEIDQAIKRDKDFRKHGQRVIDIYACEDSNKVPFNILYSNTDTLLPALYSAEPRPTVKQRNKDKQDMLAQTVSRAATKMLEYLRDTGVDGYETFDAGMRNATLDALLPGRGVTRIKYDAEIYDDAKQSELVCVDSILWDRILFGYSKKWSTLPWIAFEEHIDKDEAIRLFGREMAGKLSFLKNDDKTVEEHDQSNDDDDENQGGAKTACIYQIWDRTNKKVRYISHQYKDDFLRVDDDPLDLTGFFPIPRPIVFVEKSHDMAITAPYLVYENQAKELNSITTRINRLSKAIKANGIYDSELGSDIEHLLESDDNTFTPADKASSIAAEKGFQNAIWFLPIREMVQVLKQLIINRENCKQVIYEITGISDIIRGATNAAETATAQGLKSQWGTMRLKRMQMEVQRYARDIFRIMLEIAATKFSEESWAMMTGMQLATSMQVQQAQMMPQDPASQQVLNSVSWPQVLEALKNDRLRAYSVDIETNSTIAPEAVEDQKNISEVMTALGQYLQGVTPLVQSGSFPFEGAKAMMMAIVRRYQFGDEIEDYINQMMPPQPPPDTTTQVKELELQAKQQSEQLQQQTEASKSALMAQIEQSKIEAQRLIEQGKAATEIHIEQMRINGQIEITKLKAEAEKPDNTILVAEAKLANDLKIAQMKAENDLRIEQMKIESAERMKLCEIEQNSHSTAIEEAKTATTEADESNEEARTALIELTNYIRAPRTITLPDGRQVTVQ